MTSLFFFFLPSNKLCLSVGRKESTAAAARRAPGYRPSALATRERRKRRPSSREARLFLFSALFFLKKRRRGLVQRARVVDMLYACATADEARTRSAMSLD